jgi:hypothetical protein
VTSPFDRLTRLTTWWVEPAKAAAQALSVQPDEIMVQLIEGVATRFGGGRIEATIGGHPVRATLDGLRLVRRSERRELRAELSDAELDGVRFDELNIVAAAVRVEPGVDPRLRARDIRISGSSQLAPLVAWLDAHSREHTLLLDGDALVLRRGALDLVVDAEVRDDVVHCEVRAVRRSRVQLPLPRWLRIERKYPLTLGAGWSLLEATRRGDVVHFQLRGADVEHTFSAMQLRDAVVRGGLLRF